ncbi:hypothetical protein SAMN05428978_104011 [Nitrosomonas sp. Nm34]|nr:hypothetical protein SAMN05428978_104011 [Nitrosomonas sp. Nm34]
MVKLGNYQQDTIIKLSVAFSNVESIGSDYVQNKASPQQAAGNEIQKKLKTYRILTHQYWRNSISKSKLTLSASLVVLIRLLFTFASFWKWNN